jgi:hypothetical protein
VLAWIGAEFFGIGLGMNMFGPKNILSIFLVGLFCAFGGYLLIRSMLEKKPDAVDDDVDKIGINDLKP